MLETTKEERATVLANLVGLPDDEEVLVSAKDARALCRDVDTLVGALEDRAGAAHRFGATLGVDRSGHAGDFADCQNGKCVDARAVLGL